MLIGIFNPLGAQSDRLRCEVCQNLILSPMNTGLLRYAVATAPTVYGIETLNQHVSVCHQPDCVATAPTVYGIETLKYWLSLSPKAFKVATAPTVYGIETNRD